jgi:hypothetical protein
LGMTKMIQEIHKAIGVLTQQLAGDAAFGVA